MLYKLLKDKGYIKALKRAAESRNLERIETAEGRKKPAVQHHTNHHAN